MKGYMIAIVLFLLTNSICASDYIISGGKVKWILFEIEVSTGISRENRMELEEVESAVFMSGEKAETLTESMKKEIADKMDELNIDYSIKGATVTARQQTIKDKYGKKWKTKSEWLKVLPVE